jgi:hypothetical protein
VINGKRRPVLLQDVLIIILDFPDIANLGYNECSILHPHIICWFLRSQVLRDRQSLVVGMQRAIEI